MNKTGNNPTTEETSKNHEKQEPEQTNVRRWLVPVVIVIIIGILAFAYLQNQGNNTGSTGVDMPLRAIGPETAPVTINEYADFACISCKAWHQFGVREQVLETYGDQVRFVWHDFPVTAPTSPKAAEAGFCAHDQGQFWPYHDILFANAPALATESLKAYAAEIDLETQQFDQCLDSGIHQNSVERELNTAMSLSLRSVPSFIVNGRRLIGPPSYDQLSALIDEILQTVD